MNLKEPLDELNPFYCYLPMLCFVSFGFSGAIVCAKQNLDTLNNFYNVVECLAMSFTEAYLLLLLRFAYIKVSTLETYAQENCVLGASFLFILLPIILCNTILEPTDIRQW